MKNNLGDCYQQIIIQKILYFIHLSLIILTDGIHFVVHVYANSIKWVKYARVMPDISSMFEWQPLLTTSQFKSRMFSSVDLVSCHSQMPWCPCPLFEMRDKIDPFLTLSMSLQTYGYKLLIINNYISWNGFYFTHDPNGYCHKTSIKESPNPKAAEKNVTTYTARCIGPTWGPFGSCRPQVGPMLAPWTLLSG